MRRLVQRDRLWKARARHSGRRRDRRPHQALLHVCTHISAYIAFPRRALDGNTRRGNANNPVERDDYQKYTLENNQCANHNLYPELPLP